MQPSAVQTRAQYISLRMEVRIHRSPEPTVAVNCRTSLSNMRLPATNSQNA